MTSSPRLRTLDLAYIGLFTVFMAVCAWITIPFVVPFTLQTFALFLAPMVLGSRRGLYAITVYLLLGAVGLPVFSGFQGGPAVLFGASGGYLLGFPVFGLVYHGFTQRWGTSRRPVLAACVTGLLACYGIGTLWFRFVYARASGPVSLLSILGWCVFPFLLPDLLKLALALRLAPHLRRHLK